MEIILAIKENRFKDIAYLLPKDIKVNAYYNDTPDASIIIIIPHNSVLGFTLEEIDTLTKWVNYNPKDSCMIIEYTDKNITSIEYLNNLEEFNLKVKCEVTINE